MVPKAFVISLARCWDRAEKCVQEARNAGLDFEIIDAVDARNYKDGDDTDWEGLQRDYPFSNDNWGCQFKASEVCIHHSHLKAYKAVVDQDLDMAVVLEDDAVLNGGTTFGVHEAVSALDEIPGWFFVSMHNELPGLNKGYRVIAHPHPMFWQVRQAPLVTMASVVSRRFCEFVLKNHQIMRMPVDHLVCSISADPQYVFLQTTQAVYGCGNFTSTQE